MDYDRYRSTSFDDYDPRDPRAYGSSYNHDTTHHVPLRGRSRSSSNAASDSLPQPVQQPLKSAIGNAFDQSDAARTVDPDLIAQIAAEVKKSVLDEIKQSGIAGTTPAQPGPAPPQQHIPPSPDSTNASFPTRNVYTPPSPLYQDASGYPPAQDAPTRESTFDGSTDDLPTPRYSSSVPADIPRRDRAPERPAAAVRMATDDFTPIEKMWQRLFDQEGQPLPRLGEFLRGLAMHLIEDYEPKKSLVISPAKMQKFYEDVKVPDEIYPWKAIFGELSYPALSNVYQSMRCQHHLIQEHPAERPFIPALTPQGFEDWMTAMILAYPDTEYERISKAVLDMPISNADNIKERFPKELPRRMFPRSENMQAQQKCAANLSVEGVGPLRKAPSFPPPPPQPKVDTSTGGPSLERERSPYGGQPDVRSSESEGEHEPGFVPIERQRKPYSATPSGGKVYDDLSQSTHSDTTSTGQRRRANSTVNQSQWAPPPADTYDQQQPRSSTRRTRSPGFSSYGTYSDGNLNEVPSSYYSSNLPNVPDDGRRHSKDEELRRQHRHRRDTVGSDNLYGSQPRSSYDDYKGRSGASGYEDRGYDFRRY